MGPQNISEAWEAQKEMAKKVILDDAFDTSFDLIGGVDVSNTPFDPEQKIFAAVVVLNYPSLEVVETQGVEDRQEFPYIPGLLGFREVPALVRAYQALTYRPGILLVDGHGVSHPRGLGVASHLGVVLDIPTIGVAKSVLVGKATRPLGEDVGSTTPLVWKGKEIGKMVRTKKKCTPLIISAGHRISLPSAVACVLKSLKTYRLPEPTRQAHLAANKYRKERSLYAC
jgi:deoxyribonuclease V